MSTPILPFAVWQSGTNQNSIPANDNSLRNQILNGLVIGVANDAPGGDSDGDIYIVGSSPSGAFASFDEDDLAIFDSGTWYAFAPVQGICVNIAGALNQWDGSDYVAVTTGSGGGVDSVVAGTGISVNNTDPANPVVSTTGGGGGSYSIFDPGKPGGTLQSQRKEYFDVAGSAEVDMVNIASGAGYISSLFLAFFGTDSDWANAEVRIYYDGEVTPSVLMRHENFFFSQYAGINTAMTAEFFGFNRAASDTYGGYLNLPIPYSNGIRITIKNVTANTFKLFSTAVIHHGVPNNWPRTQRLLAKPFYVASAAPNSVQTLIDESALNGRLAAIWLLGDGLPGGATPLSAWLEGNISIFIDGAASPSYESSGTEDYFLQSFYFGGAGSNRNGGEVGTTFVNGAAGTYGAWRTHIRNPIEFDSQLKVTWQVGDTSQVPFTGTVRAWATVFYYVG